MSYRNKYNTIATSEFFCTQCGNQGIPIIRCPGKQRESGHLKKLWCPVCNETTNHAEVSPFGSYTKEDFIEEFQLGRFIEGNRLPISNLLECSKEDCLYNKNKRCWNSNYSYSCIHRPGGKNND